MEEPTMYVRAKNKQLLADNAWLQAKNSQLQKGINEELQAIKGSNVYKFFNCFGLI